MRTDTYNVDINTTTSCNLKCKYCFVAGQAKHFENIDAITNFLYRLLQSKMFLNNYKYLSINFWGGEPLLYPEFIKNIIHNFEDLGSVRFFIYSNGTKLETIKPLLLSLKDKKTGNMPKLLIQVSYDGEPLHSMFRDAAQEAREAINWLDKHDIPFTIKSTVPYEGFKHMYDAYLDVKRFASTLKSNINYFPTIEHYNSDPITPEYEIDLKNSLVKIARKELESTCKKCNNSNFFHWFSNNRAICSAGADMISVDCDGKVYPCHGCLYEDKSEHLIASIYDADSIDKIQASRKIIADVLNKGEIMCPDCSVNFCLRCNHAKFIFSDKKDYVSRWFDGKSQPDICKFYDINNKVKEAFEEIRRRTQ